MTRSPIKLSWKVKKGDGNNTNPDLFGVMRSFLLQMVRLISPPFCNHCQNNEDDIFVKDNVEMIVHTLTQALPIQYIFLELLKMRTTSFVNDLISPCHTHCQSWPRLQDCACRPSPQWAVPHYRPACSCKHQMSHLLLTFCDCKI